jgi:hypothetical protein
MPEVLDTSLHTCRLAFTSILRAPLGDLQIRFVKPVRGGDIATQGIDKDLVLVKLENNIRQPPVSLALDRVPHARIGLLCRLLGHLLLMRCESALNDLGHGHPRRERKISTGENSKRQHPRAEGIG